MEFYKSLGRSMRTQKCDMDYVANFILDRKLSKRAAKDLLAGYNESRTPKTKTTKQHATRTKH